MKYFNHRLAVALFSASLASVACAEPTGQGGAEGMEGAVSQGSAPPAFQELDKDQDGYISAVEATGDAALMDQWNNVDANSDRKIDQSEFSKFEARDAQPGAQQEMPAQEGMEQGVEGTQEQQ